MTALNLKSNFELLSMFIDSRNINHNHLYLVIDTAKDRSIFNMLQLTVEDKMGLFTEELLEDIGDISPYLLKYENNQGFIKWFSTSFWGKKCGIFLVCASGEQELLAHCRVLFNAQDESGKELIFRYYDPDILQAYLPICTEKELHSFFGPIDSFIFENRDKGIMTIEKNHSRPVAWKASTNDIQ